MAKIIVSEFITLDGVTESPEKWSLSYWNDEIAAFKHRELFAAGALLLGRTTYEGFAAAWPGRRGSDDYSDRMNDLPKYVVSSTLTDPTWSATVLRDAVAEVRALRETIEGDIVIFGSTQLARTLIAAGLVDEIRLLTYPVVRGRGKRLFDETSKATLELVEARALPRGAVLLTYRPAARAATAAA